MKDTRWAAMAVTMAAIALLAIAAIAMMTFLRGDEPLDEEGRAIRMPRADERTGEVVNAAGGAVGALPGATEAIGSFTQQNGILTDAQLARAKAAFEQEFEVNDKQRRVLNAASCKDCHSNPSTGGNATITELRSGHFEGTKFIPRSGSSLVKGLASIPALQERVFASDEIRVKRLSLSLFGLGYVETIDVSVFQQLAAAQAQEVRGLLLPVPVLEANGALRGGRFGWKGQHRSLTSFSGDATFGELGIVNRRFPGPLFSNGRAITSPDNPTDLDGQKVVVPAAAFMRSLRVPPRDAALAITPDAIAGSQIFTSIGCADCHTPTFTTPVVGFQYNAGTLQTPAVLARKVIHPYSDFLLHDLGEKDGVPVPANINAANEPVPPETANHFRTQPLWGNRTRRDHMHDGESHTNNDAIERHGGQGAAAREKFRALSPAEKLQVFTFLRSL